MSALIPGAFTLVGAEWSNQTTSTTIRASADTVTLTTVETDTRIIVICYQALGMKYLAILCQTKLKESARLL